MGCTICVNILPIAEGLFAHLVFASIEMIRQQSKEIKFASVDMENIKLEKNLHYI
jgi:hypothetical protein